jgi:hypothetical protein
MTVEVTDRRRNSDPDCLSGFGFANGTWWTIIFLPGMEKLPQVEQRRTTDPWVVSPRTAQRMADIVEKWTPPETWATDNADMRSRIHADLVHFLRHCNGFRTY